MIIYINQSKLRDQEKRDNRAAFWFAMSCLSLVGFVLWNALWAVVA